MPCDAPVITATFCTALIVDLRLLVIDRVAPIDPR